MKQTKIKETITRRDSDSFKKYLQEISSIPVLTPDEEYEIAMHAYKGNKHYRELLVRHNLKFVISVAKQYETSELKLEDLVNEGNYGLIKAAEKFDPTKGFKFISYGVWWIKRDILAYIADNGRLIRLPNNKNNIMHKLNRKYESLEQQLQRRPLYSELVEFVNGEFDSSDVAFYLDTISNPIVSLDTPVNNDDQDNSLYNVIKDENVVRTDYIVNNQDTEYQIDTMLKLLKDDKERKVITLLYGLDGNEPMKLKGVGLILGLTSERVRQIRDTSINRLRKYLR